MTPRRSISALRRHFIGHTFVDEAPHLTIQSFYSAIRPSLLITLEEYNDHREWKIQACLQITVKKEEEERSATSTFLLYPSNPILWTTK